MKSLGPLGLLVALILCPVIATAAPFFVAAAVIGVLLRASKPSRD